MPAGVVQNSWEDAENVPIRTLKVSPKRAKIEARAGPIWHYVALRGTRAPTTCSGGGGVAPSSRARAPGLSQARSVFRTPPWARRSTKRGGERLTGASDPRRTALFSIEYRAEQRSHQVSQLCALRAGGTRGRFEVLTFVVAARQEDGLRVVLRETRATRVPAPGEAANEEIRIALPGSATCWLSARVLESGEFDDDGSGCDIISGRFGNGEGKWRLSVTASGGDIQVMSLLMSSTGHLTNLSASVGAWSEEHFLPLFLPVPGRLLTH